jgi:protein-disulfide isomerase
MKRKHSWFIALLVAVLLVSACGPEMTTPTPSNTDSAEKPAATATQAKETAGSMPTSAAAGELPVDASDWHVLGSADAPVTIVEYSEFQ